MKKILPRGFTLIELLIVIAIIGIMTSFVLTNLQGARERGRDVRRKTDLEAINQALRLYFTDAHHFPGYSPGYNITGCGTIASPSECAWGTPFATSTNTYLNFLPYDPSSTTTSTVTYNYYSDGADIFALMAVLENASDSDIAVSQANCQQAYADFAAAGGNQMANDYVICPQ